MRLRERLRAQPLPRRLGLALTLAAVVAGTLLGLFGVSAARVDAERDYVTGPVFDSVISSARRFRAVVDQETGLRGYALSRSRTFLEPYSAGLALQERSSAELDRLLAGDAELATASEGVDAAAARWRTTYADPTLARVAAGEDVGSEADLQLGRTLFDDVRSANDRYATLLLSRRDGALSRLGDAERVRTATVVASVVLGLLIVLGLALALRRWVTTPLARLAEETRTVRTGDLEHRVTVTGPPEVVGLARDVDLMRLGLVEQVVRAEAAGAEVERARAALETQAEELARSNRDLEQFAYVASHDLQEPLRKVASFCQLLQRRYGGQLDARADQYIEFAVDGAKRMQVLINDLLAFSRVGRRSGEPSEVDLEACLAAALRNLSARIEETGAEVTHEPLPVVRGEASLLTTLLQNLVGNGLKFAGDAPPRVHLGVRRLEGGSEDGVGAEEWEFWCADDGIGIEPQYAERIFVIFQRLHGREEYEGTGIGLALVKKIVEHHGGRIWLDPAGLAGWSGAVFRFTLPVLEAPRPPAPERSVLSLSTQGGTDG